MVPACLGTQVGGSIIRPASYCGNFALKPTQGALNRGERQGLSQSTLGPHANSLEDLWAVARQIAWVAGGDPGAPGLYGPPKAALPVKPRRLAVVESEGFAAADAGSSAAFRDLVTRLSGLGVEMISRKESARIEAYERSVEGAMEMTGVIVGWEARWVWRNLARRYPEAMSASLKDRLAKADTYTPETFRLALLKREDMRRRHAELMADVDAVIALSSPGVAPESGPVGGTAPRTTGSATCNAFTSAIGMPALTMPLLAVDGLPVGVQLCGPHHGDHMLTGLAAWIVGAVRS
jgi:Asp-tRNA(Asn)/Glu-tRNA(Gln) amidotransferase A subunit family amidase